MGSKLLVLKVYISVFLTIWTTSVLGYPDPPTDFHDGCTGISEDGGICVCKPCNNEGCQRDPVFLRRYDSVSIDADTSADTEIYTANACVQDLYYTIDSSNDEAAFDINPYTGQVYFLGTEEPVKLYELNIVARNVEGKTDLMTLMVHNHLEHLNTYDPKGHFGYESAENFDEQPFYHHIHKRSVDLSEVNITLEKIEPYSSVTTMYVGSRVAFRLTILFPQPGPTDMLVELFTPDNDTTVMILCDVTVTHVGSNLAYTGSITPVMDSRTSGSIMYDRAILDFGNVTNDGIDITIEDNSTIAIEFEAVMIPNDQTVYGQTYWVSAGAEYYDETEIFVAQASFTAEEGQNITTDPTFSMNGLTTVPMGSSEIYSVDMNIPYSSSALVFDAFAPLSTSGVMSICAVRLKDYGSYYGCGWDTSAITSSYTADTGGKGNSRASVDLRTPINKGSRDATPTVADSRITVEFVAHVYEDPSLESSLQAVGAALDINSEEIWTGSLDVTLAAAEDPSGAGDPTMLMSTPNGNSANLGDSIVVNVDLTIPAGVATTYDIQLFAPFNDSAAVYKVCSFKILSAGKNLPCLDTGVTAVYSTRNTGSADADVATLSLGYVDKVNLYSDSAEDKIVLQGILVSLGNHSLAVDPSTHKVSSAVTYGGGKILVGLLDINIDGPETHTSITNSTSPTFNMSFPDGNDQIPVDGSAEILLKMSTVRNTVYPRMDFEASTPTVNDSAKYHICHVKVQSAGKNLPCINPSWNNQFISYSSKYNVSDMDRATLSLGNMANVENEDSAPEDDLDISIFVKILDHVAISDNDKDWLSVGMMYAEDRMWVGQLAVFARVGLPITNVIAPHVAVTNVSPLTPVPVGYTATYNVLIKLPPGNDTELIVTVTSDAEGLNVCMLRVLQVGDNIPCVNKTTLPTFVYHPNGAKKGAVSSFGIVKNYGSSAMVADNNFDEGSILLEVLLQVDPTASASVYTFDVSVAYDTPGTSIDVLDETVSVTTNQAGINTTITEDAVVTFSIGEITGGDTTANTAIGESKRFVHSIRMPVNVTQKVKVKLSTPGNTGQLELCSATIVSVGNNIPCLSTNILPTITSWPASIFDDIAEFDLGYVCSNSMFDDLETENLITIEAIFRVNDNGVNSVSDSISVTSSYNVFDGGKITTGDVSLTVVGTFDDRFLDLAADTSNLTLLSINTSSSGAIPMTIGQVMTLPVTLTVQQNSVAKVAVDVKPVANETACMTVNGMRVISAGSNLACFEANAAKGKIFTPEYNNTLGNSQQTYGYLDLGTVTNTGLSYRQGTAVMADDQINLEIDVQMADCSLAEDGVVFPLSIGGKTAQFVVIYEADVSVSRNGEELPDITLDVAVSGTSTTEMVVLDCLLQHNANSSAEGFNTSALISAPAFLVPCAGGFVSMTNMTPDVEIFDSEGQIEITFNEFLFTDVAAFTLCLEVNTSAAVPNSILTDDTKIMYQSGTNFNVRAGTVYSTEKWFDYVTSALDHVNFTILVGGADGCSNALGMEDLRIQDCQISSSVQSDPNNQAFKGRWNKATAWQPYIRNGKTAENRYIKVCFGNKTIVTKIGMQQAIAVAHRANLLKIQYSDDGQAWWHGETSSLPSPSTSDEVILSQPTEARCIRILVTGDTANKVKPQLGLRFEFYGCYRSSDVLPADVCNWGQTEEESTDIFYRSFVGDATAVYVCDTDPATMESHCHSSTDGIVWNNLDSSLGSMIGLNSDYVYGYGTDKTTVLVSQDGGATWETTSPSMLQTDQSAAGWVSAKAVPWQLTNLDGATPHADYTIGNWGVTYDGIHRNSGGWSQVAEWTSCCP